MYSFNNFASTTKTDELAKLVEVIGDAYVPADIREEARCEASRNARLMWAQNLVVHELAPAFRDAGVQLNELAVDEDRTACRVIPGFDLIISDQITISLDYTPAVEDTYLEATLIVASNNGKKAAIKIVAFGYKAGEKIFSLAAPDRAKEIFADAKNYSPLTRGLVMKLLTEVRKSLGWSDED